jgi:hypothetical protein
LEEVPEKVNANLVYRAGALNYTSDTDFEKIETTLSEFIEFWRNYGALVVHWVSGDSLYVGAVYVQSGVTVLRYVQVEVVGL